MDSFLMIGQSNMAGRGRLEEVLPIENDQLFMLRNGRFRLLVEPVNYDRPYSGAGPAVSFADAYQKAYQQPVGLIPCADGGTSLADWAVGGALYTNAVYQTKLAQNVSSVKGILWHQGESDSKERATAQNYSERFSRMITELRRECHLEEVPLIMGELGTFLAEDERKRHLYFFIVNEEIHRAADSLPYCAVASSKGLGSNGDFLHFNSQAQRIFGRRYFDAYQEVCSRR